MANLKIEIDEELCIGCGTCIGPCVGGALEIQDGKCKVISEDLCDGMGVCLGICPTGALQLRDTETGQAINTEDAPYERMKAAVEAGLAKPEERAFVEEHDPHKTKKQSRQCFMCKTSEDEAYLVQLAHQGKSSWVCTHCLPRLIHG